MAIATITVADLVTHSRLEPAAALGLLLGGWWYVAATRRLAQRGRRWPLRRTVPYLAGLAVIAIATQTGVAAYDTTYFTAHVVQHLLLGMVGPVLLALGAPVTLALQASRRDTRRRLLKLLHSPPIRVLTHPLTAWALFGGSMFALYFTGLYVDTLRNTALHDLVHLQFVLAGCLFFWLVVGLDPTPHRLPYAGRMLYVLVAIPFHTILGVALITQTKLIAPGITLSDQQAGAGILWSAGEALGLVAVMVVAGQWMNAEEREAVRLDRQLDAAVPS
ncbi:MAG TPA: cytochrome c oxidase assembly protein [Acidimicrobiales bacterium]|nr:cytochrome c oxidase assembly protein [Acidimicrobiales bacterium]